MACAKDLVRRISPNVPGAYTMATGPGQGNCHGVFVGEIVGKGKPYYDDYGQLFMSISTDFMI